MKFFVLMSLLFLQVTSLAEEGPSVIAVGEAELQLDALVFEPAYYPAAATLRDKLNGKEMIEAIRNDFSFYKSSFKELTLKHQGVKSFDKFEWKNLQENKASFMIRGKFFSDNGSLHYKLVAYDVLKKESLVEMSGSYKAGEQRFKAHQFSNRLFKKITQKDSIFLSKIIFVSDRHGTRKNPVKEVYMMDFDGENKKRLTHHGGMVISPAISQDRNRILYSLISRKKSKRRNINLMLLDLRTGKSKILSKRRGINSGAIFMPGGESIALTLSHSGNAEIYVMNLKTMKLRRITKSLSPDVDPSITSDGSLMAILSGRAGKPMIYTLNPRATESKVKRISFVGKFNATPRFSPSGKEIVFSSWLDTRFDIFRIDANGDNLARLTKDFGSNEDPTYSNDGQFIAFSSQRVLSRRKAVQNIYIMDKDGDIFGKITDNFGNCITPRWSK